MRILVAYATRHGATRGIAERISQTLEQTGLDVTIQSVEAAGSLDQYDAFVVGSAAYMGRWIDAAASFVRRNREVLASRPVWLFSSGPVGTETVDAKGRDVIKASEPREFAEFNGAIHPVDERVFFGAYDPDAEPIGLAEQLGARFMCLPGIREALPAGDFRDWPEIEAWAGGIAHKLQGEPTANLA
jgi:menaquinone-dependent protoporphyrinogen oxidase